MDLKFLVRMYTRVSLRRVELRFSVQINCHSSILPQYNWISYNVHTLYMYMYYHTWRFVIPGVKNKHCDIATYTVHVHVCNLLYVYICTVHMCVYMSGVFAIVTVTLTTSGVFIDQVVYETFLIVWQKKFFINISFWSVFCVYDIPL